MQVRSWGLRRNWESTGKPGMVGRFEGRDVFTRFIGYLPHPLPHQERKAWAPRRNGQLALLYAPSSPLSIKFFTGVD
jgi:hypothetical protein